METKNNYNLIPTYRRSFGTGWQVMKDNFLRLFLVIIVLAVLAAPFKMMDFSLIPTGGVDEKNFSSFMAADRVIACGASYPVQSTLVDAEKFDELENRIAHIKEICDSLQ